MEHKIRKAYSKFKSKDEMRHTVNDVWSIPDLGMVACDGHRMIVWHDDTVDMSDKPMIYPSYGDKSVFYNKGMVTEIKPPNFKSFIPNKISDAVSVRTLLPLWLSKVETSKKPVIAMLTNDGRVELKLDGSDTTNKLGLDLRLLSPLAGEVVTLIYNSTDKASRIKFIVEGTSTYGVVMPMRL